MLAITTPHLRLPFQLHARKCFPSPFSLTRIRNSSNFRPRIADRSCHCLLEHKPAQPPQWSVFSCPRVQVSVTTTSSLTHRIISKRIQGLHPAIPETAEPLCANVATAAVIISPMTAAILLVGRIVIRRPLLSLPTKSAYFFTRAGLAFVAVAPAAAYLSHYQSQIPTSILRYEGITPPRYQIWQSSKEFTYDDAILIGGIGGMLLSFRLRGLRSLSIGNSLLGRLGACSTGMSSALVIGDISLFGQDADRHKPSIQRSIYERAVALRKLNDDPKFNQSLASGPQLAERI
jgi:hypothetical protein